MTHPVNRGSTLFLRLVISLVAIAALTVCALPLARMISTAAAKTPETAWQIHLFIFGAFASGVVAAAAAVLQTQVQRAIDAQS